MLIPVCAIIPTYNRPEVLRKCLATVASQDTQFEEIVIVDASDVNETRLQCEQGVANLRSRLIYTKANERGAAAQRNQGFWMTRQPFIAFMDDDVYLEEYCIGRLWRCFQAEEKVGGVSAMITNQKFEQLGAITTLMCKLLDPIRPSSYAGKVIGPAWNFLPSDDTTLAEYVKIDWLNLGFTIYRREALPEPPFQNHFKGYSMMEDLTLSLFVSQSWNLCNARLARIFHDSQPGLHKSNIRTLQKMSLVNRYFIMANVMKKSRLRDKVSLFMFELFNLLSLARSIKTLPSLPSSIIGKLDGTWELLKK